MSDAPPARPDLASVETGTELRRWYWMKAELLAECRRRGLPTSGSKPDLTERLAADLDGVDPPTPARRTTSSRRLPEPLADDTPIRPGQAATQQLRAFFVERIGSGFRYDVFMREAIAAGDTTLGELVAHWYATRDAEPPPTLPQLEYVRFTRAWFAARPDGDPAACRRAWAEFRALPVELRPDPAELDGGSG